ncbi:MAG TPA: hypothetical protein VEJ87_13510 [Acidimicrobiales bacterium]|nr:hypothetical protein [Acidimicrobiales bacterium]
MSMVLKMLAIISIVVASVACVSTTWAASSGGGDGGSTASGGDGGGTVTVTVSTGSTSPGSSGVSGGSPAGGAGNSGPTCVYIQVPPQEQQSLGLGGSTPGAWYQVRCPSEQTDYSSVNLVWIANSNGSAPPSFTVNPLTLASEAEDSIHLPNPIIGLDPPEFSVVQLPTWLWIDSAIWHPVAASASTDGITATAVATPVSVDWSMGDGSVVQCVGPGTPYDPSFPPGTQTSDCTYTYLQSSAGQPSTNGDPNDGAFDVTATIAWNVTWVASGIVAGGSLPELETSSSVQVRVEQVESIQAH